MTTIRALDSDGDWTFGNGKSNYKNLQKGLEQHIITRLREWKGDCFFANSSGIDYNNRLGYKNQETLLEEEVRDILLKTEGVIEIISVDISLENREATITASIKTIYNTTTITA